MSKPLPITGVAGIRGLTLAVIYRAVLDARSSSPKLRKEARQFFESEWYETLLEVLDMPPDTRPVLEN